MIHPPHTHTASPLPCLPPLPFPLFQVRTIDTVSSTRARSLMNLFKIRPEGSTSKKGIAAPKIPPSSRLCMCLDAAMDPNVMRIVAVVCIPHDAAPRAPYLRNNQ